MFGCYKSHAKLVDNHEYGIISAVSAQSNYNIYFEIFIFTSSILLSGCPKILSKFPK